MRRNDGAILLALAGCLTACSPRGQVTQQQTTGAANSASATSQTPPFVITATIKELMASTVDPSADAVWDSVAIISSRQGTDERRPRTEEQWQTVRHHAMTLVEATNLLMMEGRHAAPRGTQGGAGELSPTEIDQRIASSRSAFVQFAQGLRITATKALDAIDRKDSEGLLQAGGDIDQSCEDCHVTYWYPNQGIYTK